MVLVVPGSSQSFCGHGACMSNRYFYHVVRASTVGASRSGTGLQQPPAPSWRIARNRLGCFRVAVVAVVIVVVAIVAVAVVVVVVLVVIPHHSGVGPLDFQVKSPLVFV